MVLKGTDQRTHHTTSAQILWCAVGNYVLCGGGDLEILKSLLRHQSGFIRVWLVKVDQQ